MALSLSLSPPRRRLSSWTAPGRRETIFVFCLFAVALFIFQSNLSISYSDDEDSSSASWSWRSNSDWFSSGSAYRSGDSPTKLKSTGENIMPSIQGSENNGLTVNDVTVSWNGPKEKMPQSTVVQHTEGEFGVACFACASKRFTLPSLPFLRFPLSFWFLSLTDNPSFNSFILAGFTILDNIYSHNGTLYIVSDSPKSFPALRTIISSGYPVFNGEDEVKKREPTDQDMQIITVKQAEKKFGKLAHRLEGTTVSASVAYDVVLCVNVIARH